MLWQCWLWQPQLHRRGRQSRRSVAPVMTRHAAYAQCTAHSYVSDPLNSMPHDPDNGIPGFHKQASKKEYAMGVG